MSALLSEYAAYIWAALAALIVVGGAVALLLARWWPVSIEDGCECCADDDHNPISHPENWP